MADVTANGQRVIEGEIYEPARGPWTARLEIDLDEGVSLMSRGGAVEIAIGSARWVGVLEGAISQSERGIVRVVGGRGGLKKTLPAKYYYQASLRSVVDDVLRESGETLDQDEHEAGATSRNVPRWARMRGEARSALAAVAEELGGFWRVSRAGGVLLRSAESWETVSDTYVEIERDEASKSAIIAPDETPSARPGVTLGADRVVEARTTFDSRGVRQKLMFEAESRSRSPAAAVVDAAKRANEVALSYAQWYPAKIVAQESDGSVQLYPDDPRIRGNGLTKVPLRHGIPGLKVKVSPGQRVLLFFENGDPKQPVAALYPEDAAAAHPIVLGDLLDQLLRTLVVSTAMGPSGYPITTDPVWQQYLSRKYKIDG